MKNYDLKNILFYSCFNEKIINGITQDDDLNICGYYSSINNVIDNGKKVHIDVLVFSLNSDSAVLDEIDQIQSYDCFKSTRFVAVTNYTSDFINVLLKNHKVDYVYEENLPIESLVKNLKFMNNNSNSNVFDEKSSFDSEVAIALQEFGISPHLQGYYFLKYGISLIYDNIAYLSCITSKLYPDIALKFDTNKVNVERCIRSAIIRAWNNSNPEIISDYFSNAILAKKDGPSNSQFMACVAERLRINRHKNHFYNF